MSNGLKNFLISVSSSVLGSAIFASYGHFFPNAPLVEFIKAHYLGIIITLFFCTSIFIYPTILYVKWYFSAKKLPHPSYTFVKKHIQAPHNKDTFESRISMLNETFDIFGTSLGILDCYETRDEAIEENSQSLNDSRTIDTLNFKCRVLLNDQDADKTLAFKLASNPRKQMRCLVLSPKEDSDRYIRNRIKEIQGKTDSDVLQHRKKIKAAVEDLFYIKNYCQSNISCRYFCEELKWSLVITDNYLLVTFYGTEKSNKAPCFKIKKDSQWGNL